MAVPILVKSSSNEGVQNGDVDFEHEGARYVNQTGGVATIEAGEVANSNFTFELKFSSCRADEFVPPQSKGDPEVSLFCDLIKP